MIGTPALSAPAGVQREPTDVGSRVVSAACEFFGIEDRTLLFSKRRRGELSPARWAIAFVLLTHAGWTLTRVGTLLGKDHSSVHYGREKAAELIRIDPLFFAACQRLEREV